MEGAADNRLHSDTRPTFWLVSYEMDPEFFKLGGDEQFRRETADGVHAVALAFERIWKAGYISTDFRKGWILFDLGKKAAQAEVEEVLHGYPMHRYFQNVKYNPVYSATAAGFDFKMIWSGFKEFIKERFDDDDDEKRGARA
jgi:hypothetical protein